MKDAVVGPDSAFNLLVNPYTFGGALAYFMRLGGFVKHAVLSETSVTADAGLVVVLGLGTLWRSRYVMALIN